MADLLAFTANGTDVMERRQRDGIWFLYEQRTAVTLTDFRERPVNASRTRFALGCGSSS